MRANTTGRGHRLLSVERTGPVLQPTEHDPVLVEVEDVRARLLTDRRDLGDALRVLDEAEEAAGAPLVDQAERQRLEAAAADDADLGEHHHAILAHRDGACVGYAGVVVPGGEGHGVGDVAFQHGMERCGDVLRALLEAVDKLVRAHDAHGTQMWIRHATADDVLAAVAAGYAVERRLAVLGRGLPASAAEGAPPTDVRVRPSAPGDIPDVVTILAAAYRGTADEGWDRQRFGEHAAAAWFSHEDLLVAEDGDGVVGLHWTKRRGDGVGEVYNLAVAPRAQGRGLGRHLLDAGLQHLHEVSCGEVVLWVDLANESAVRLYTTAGFTTRWEDIAFVRHTRAVSRHHHPVGSGLPPGH